MFLTPAAGLATILATQDWQGLKQAAFTGVTTVGVTYALKYLVKKERPDMSDNHSFPSMHTAISFGGAAYIQRRYGWKWGIPAYVVSTYVGWSPCLRQETRLVGRSGRSSYWRGQCLHFYPSIRQEARFGHQPGRG